MGSQLQEFMSRLTVWPPEPATVIIMIALAALAFLLFGMSLGRSQARRKGVSGLPAASALPADLYIEVEPESRRRAAAALADFAAEASAARDPALTRAMIEAQAGDTSRAEQVLEERRRAAPEGVAKSAVTRRLAAFVGASAPERAVTLYQEATQAAPGDFDSWLGLGEANRVMGRLNEAEAALLRAKEAAAPAGDNMRARPMIMLNLAEVYRRQRREVEAREIYRAAHAAFERRSVALPLDQDVKRDLASSWRAMGEISAAARDMSEAAKALERSLMLREELAIAAPQDMTRKRDLATLWDTISEVRREADDAPGAMKAMERSVALRKEIVEASRDPMARRSLTIALNRLGALRRAQNDLDGARKAYDEALEIRKGLLAADPDNLQWMRDLSIAWERMGDLHALANRMDEARDAHRHRLVLAERLAARDGDSTQWRADLSVARYKLAQVTTGAERIAHLETALSLLEPLAIAGRLPAYQIEWVGVLKQELGRPVA